MKIKELFENDIPEGAPLVVTVISNLLKRGVEVRAYYKGDGGPVTSIKWDADHVTGITTIGISGVFHPSLIINDRNLETLELHEVPTSSFSSKKMFILRKPDVVTEAKKLAPEWAMQEQAEFASFVKQFNMQLMTRKVEHQMPDQWLIGGEIKDTDRGGAITLPIETRFKAFKRGLAEFLLAKAKEHPERYLKIVSNPRGWRTSPHYIYPNDTLRQVEHIIEDNVHKDTYRQPTYGQPRTHVWTVYVLWSISEPK